MKKLWLVVAGALLLGTVAAAAAADEAASENRPVDARVTRVRLDGVVDLRVRQGAVASLVLSGDPRWVAQTISRQSGDTLVIESADHRVSGSTRRGLHAELVLPALRELVSESLGTSLVTGFNGDNLQLSLDGAGSITMQGMNADLLELNLEGAGHVTLEGRTRVLRANLEGLGGLDAQQFLAESVSIELSGLGSATVNAHLNANLNLSGLGSVTVYGKPLNRKVSVDGLGKVSWK